MKKDIVFNEKNKKFEFSFDGKILTKKKDKVKLFNKLIKCANVFIKIKQKRNFMKLYGFLIFNDKYKLLKNNINFRCNKNNYPIKQLFRIKIPFTCFIISFYSSNIFYKDFYNAPIHNRLVILYRNEEGYGFYKRIKYNFLKKDKTSFKSSKVKKIIENNTAIFLRQSTNNSAFITVRQVNKTDDNFEQIKLNFAYVISKFIFKRPILLYEKEGKKYEESAAVLYEKLMDKNYKNVYFILDKKSDHAKLVPNKYQKNIIWKYSLKNYIYFFLAKTFIGTEVPAHTVDIRITNRFAERKLNQKKFQYIFLQHGVMYMVSLASKTRKAFRKGRLIGTKDKTVVSSMEEAKHFIEDGNYEMDDLYITGLPKFDTAYRYEDADKIIIMPTWRQWEYNSVRSNPKNTGYYKMIFDIYNSIPANLKSKTIVLPHPLFLDLVKDDSIFKLPQFDSYDELLRDTSVLITDYSSIASDAFYRGANVIFWWKDKDQCMDKYGGFLKINENNIYGDICYDKTELNKAIKDRYQKTQSEKHKANFKKIVEFSDGKNTERLIKLLIKDNVI
jgi:hypothetical protein